MSATPIKFPLDAASLARERRRVIFGSALGSAFEWYEFFVYGTLAPIIAKQFFTGVSETAGFIFALLTFAIGFLSRPFGSLVFGRLGDLVGRKYTFLMTMSTMAIPTFMVGLLPGYTSIGIAAPIILILLRVIQGLSLGGEFGGAMVYVYEHAKLGRRGRDTSWIASMGAGGVILAILVQLVVQTSLGAAAFADWGWRIPFLLSVVLFGLTLWVRLSLSESPVFVEMKASGKSSTTPIADAFGNAEVSKTALLLVIGGIAGLAAIAYTALFYGQYFMTRTLKIDSATASYILVPALLISIPCYPLFGWFSDKWGRKAVLISGLAVTALTVMPTFKAMTSQGNPTLEVAQRASPVTVYSDPSECSFQFNPVNTAAFTSSCDLAKSFLANQMVSYTNAPLPQGSTAYMTIGATRVDSFNGSTLGKADLKDRSKAFQGTVSKALLAEHYPSSANPQGINYIGLAALMSWLLILYAWCFGAVPAYMCELFSAKIRLTALSLPYNLGTGIFGGFMPATAFAMVAANGNIYYGLWFTIVLCLIGIPVAYFFLPETHGRTLEDDGNTDRLVKRRT